MFLRLVLLISLAMFTSAGDLNDINMSHITLTVSNLSSSLSFYSHLLGGMIVEDLSSLTPVTGEVYQRIFSAGDLHTDRSHKVSWVFLMFDNLMVQLVQFNLKETSNDPPANQAYPNPLKKMQRPTIAFWLNESVDISVYVEGLIANSHKLGLSQVKFQYPLLKHETANKRAANDQVDKLRFNALRGMSIAFGEGPDGENIKFIQLGGASKKAFGRHYCQSMTVGSGFMDFYDVDKCSEYKKTLSSKLYGIQHVSIPTTNITKSMDFYTKKLSAYMIEDIQPTGLKSAALESIFKLALSHKHMQTLQNQPANPVGSFPDSLDLALNMRYLLLGNIMIELVYLTGAPPNMMAKLHQTVSAGALSSPGDVTFNLATSTLDKFEQVVYGVTETDLTSCHCSVWSGHCFLCRISRYLGVEAADSWCRSACAASRVNSMDLKVTQGPLRGLYQTPIKNPDARMNLVYFSGDFRKSLYLAMREYGAVSTIVNGFNPYTQYRHDLFCSALNQPTGDEL